ncbi:C-factor isoform X2 [Vanessa atalanta]|uniref:C-factor isoform X2 n=1 Tax=Vanessa atalanta TaxID=42275 RepID=UPI001FCDFCB7|nr:C-factor isoform X2 [Vanessa atalanta]
MKSVLITGANRGLGLGMVKYLTKNDKARIIFATCRKPSEELTNLSQEHKNLHILNLGVTTKFTKLQLVKAEQLLENLTVNTIAPIMLTKSLHPILKQAVEANSDKLIGAQRAVVINMSSILGSIALNDQGGFYPYRCSKAALNAATKSMSIDLKKDQIVVAALHPGWVKTDMGGKNAPLDVDTSVSGIFNTIEKLKEADSGKFLQYDGTELAW